MRSAAVVMGVTLLMCFSDGARAQTAAAPPAPAIDWTGVGRFTVGADALAWWLKDSPVPVPVVTDGILGATDTHTLLGGRSLSTGANPGLRVSASYALTDRTGVEANFFYLASRSKSASVASSGELGSTDLFVPYVDAITQQESATELSMAPIYRGSAREEVGNSLQGAELNATWALAPAGAWRIDLLAGLRYLRLHETYTLTTQSPYTPAFGPDIWDTTDRFDTTNHFYGAQAGVRTRFDEGRLFAGGAIKVGLGAMVESASISGSLVTNDFTAFGPTQAFAGGYFALPTNIGNYSRTAFAVVPELTLNLGYRLTPAATLVVGYSLLYASDVARPGDQMSRTINTSQSTSYTQDPDAHRDGPAQPAFRFNTASFWVQGINVGLVVRF
jgi:putative beta barrel porin BBP7